MEKLTSVDLFSGCGGFGLGASLAGFSTKLAIDIDPILSSGYQLNFPNVRHENWDLQTATNQVVRHAIDGVHIDLVTGGPPCQGFSEIGRRDEDDPRNSLVGHFFRAVSAINPKVFVMENVPGLLAPEHEDTLAEGLKLVDNRYTILEPRTYVASEYGAATARKRALVIGYDSNRCAGFSLGDFVPHPSIGNAVSVGNAITDLPSACVSASDTNEWGWAKYRSESETTLNEYALWARKQPEGGLGSDIAKEALSNGLVSGNQKTNHRPATTKRFRRTKPGSVEKISRYHRLQFDATCPTLRAGTGPDRGSFQSARPIHPTSPRVITVREAARLQGFPDWFLFHPTKWHSFRMIGNSVCPVFAKEILSIVAHTMRDDSSSREIAA